MTALSNRMRALAGKLTEKYGADAVVTRKTEGAFNPETQQEVPGEVISDNVKAVIEDFQAHEINGQYTTGNRNQAKTDSIQYGDKKILLPKTGLKNLVEPAPGDTIDFNGDKYRVIASSGLSAGDSFAGYEVQARR